MVIGEVLLVCTCGILGIFLGSQITEAVLLVPYWKTLSADDFFKLHRTYGKKIHGFYAPLTIAATLLPLATVAYHLAAASGFSLLFAGLGLSTLAFFATYFMYFKRANRSFAERGISNAELPQELKRWGQWHWSRVGLEALAFAIALWLILECQAAV